MKDQKLRLYHIRRNELKLITDLLLKSSREQRHQNSARGKINIPRVQDSLENDTERSLFHRVDIHYGTTPYH